MESNPLTSFSIERIASVNLDLFGIGISLTNNSFYIIVSVFLLLFILNQNNNIVGKVLVPSNIGLVGETIHGSILAMARNTIGNQSMLPLLLALFGVIMFANLVSNIPYSYASTSSVALSLGFSFTVFIGVTALAISIKGWVFLATFVPAGTPNILLPLLVLIELVSYTARAISLGVRLFANLVAGHTLLNIISSMTNKIITSSWLGLLLGLIPISLLIILVGLEVAVALIQAYVFTILTAIYIDEAIKPLV